MYTVKQLSDLANVSVRTLHYYDEIGLLHPSKVGSNSYRYYDDAAVLRLQQILFYREIGLELMQIKDILDDPNFDVVTALQSHRMVLQDKIQRLQNLVGTVDNTISHLAGEIPMSKKRLFEGFDEEQQKEYEREARLQWGPDTVNESIRRMNSYTETQREQVFLEASQIYIDIIEAIKAGISPHSSEVQVMIQRWQNNLRHFYEPTIDIMRGLGEAYNNDPGFNGFFKTMHVDLPEYLETAIIRYVDDLEYAEIERMLAEDEAYRARR
ncbi:MAG TPA: MerR family transcriptional regulator [Phototrophicaceae bacterium]|nr:MerR family transcriptional regulator [Phototrophicaceae bacterium]